MTMLGAAQRADATIVRAHGGGGEMMACLIQDHILAALGNRTLNELTDGAVLSTKTSRIVFTTDSFVVSPLEFPGGDIGRLAVCGTINDLAVMGGRPVGLSLGMIIEEGFALGSLDRILRSIADAAKEAGVPVVTGDTKVIEHGIAGTGLILNTAGVAELDDAVELSFSRIQPGDAVVVNGTLGDHGMAVLSVRNGIEFKTTLTSDAAPLNGLIAELLAAGADIHFMRDPTRGGLAGVLADISENTGLSIEIEEGKVPVNAAVRAATEMLGFDVLTVANEGKAVLVVADADIERCLNVMRRHRYGRRSASIGRVVAGDPPLVELITTVGGRRIIQRPYGEELPRIC